MKKNKLKKGMSFFLIIIMAFVSVGYLGTDETYAATNGIYKGVDYTLVFDYNYYYKCYPDLQKGIGYDSSKLLEHFVEHGMDEGRQGRQSFDVKYYRNHYKDLNNAFKNNTKLYYLHYINDGKKEGRIAASTTVYMGINYSAVYDPAYYSAKYPDLKRGYGNNTEALITHFVEHGMSEGRKGKSTFDVKFYKYAYPDLSRGYGNNYKLYYLHYLSYGIKEGRKGYSTSFYNGVDYSPVYNMDYYKNSYYDLYRAFGNNYEALISHFVNHGMKEGRQGNGTFNVYYYMNRYPDLYRGYNRDFAKYYMHYLFYGRYEGRYGNLTSSYTGWYKNQGKVFYYKAGRIVKGFCTIDNRKYYFNDLGALKSKTGIDVSQYQGKIDWEQVKKDGVEFAIIRLGYGMDLEKQDDAYAIYNMTECERLNIPYGVYMFSYATEVGGTKGVVSEIAHTLRLLQGRNPSVGVFIDVEQDSYKNANPVPSGATVSSICLEFNKQLTVAGYKTGTYTNTYFYDTMVTNDELDNYIKWVAEYSDSCTYEKPYLMWQYSSKGSVAGIGGNVDMNIMLLN